MTEGALEAFERDWADQDLQFAMMAGKDALSAINKELQNASEVSVTPTAIIDAMHSDEILPEMRTLIDTLAKFSTHSLHDQRG